MKTGTIVKVIYEPPPPPTEAITEAQAYQIWLQHFEPLLLCSDEHDAERLQEFEKDVLSYIRNLKI